MSIAQLPEVTCSATSCGYHHDGCKAPAINVGSDDACTTFLPLSVSGGLATVTSHVGACKRTDCTHNDHAVCTAVSVRIIGSSDTAKCETFTTA